MEVKTRLYRVTQPIAQFITYSTIAALILLSPALAGLIIQGV